MLGDIGGEWGNDDVENDDDPQNDDAGSSSIEMETVRYSYSYLEHGRGGSECSQALGEQ